MKAHPAAELFPLMPENELAELAEDIREWGLMEPIVVHEEMILDGRNRYAACQRVGADIVTKEWDGAGGSPTSFVLSHNLLRRHLTPSQRAAIAAEALPQFKAERPPGRPPKNPGTNARVSASEAAGAAVGVGERYVREAAAIKEADPEVFEEVKRGEKTIKAASREVGRSAPPQEKPRDSTPAPSPIRGSRHKRTAVELVDNILAQILPTLAALEYVSVPEARETSSPEQREEWLKKIGEAVAVLNKLRKGIGGK